MRSTGIVLIFSLLGCDDSLNDKQQDARRVGAETEEKIDTAVAKTQREIDAARAEASDDIAKAKEEATERAHDALAEGREDVLEAKKSARQTVQEAQDAIREAGKKSRLSVEEDLDEIDDRVKKARENLKNKTGDAHALAEQSLSEVSETTAEIRADVKAFETKTVQSIQEYQMELNRKIGALLANLEKAEKT